MDDETDNRVPGCGIGDGDRRDLDTRDWRAGSDQARRDARGVRHDAEWDSYRGLHADEREWHGSARDQLRRDHHVDPRARSRRQARRTSSSASTRSTAISKTRRFSARSSAATATASRKGSSRWTARRTRSPSTTRRITCTAGPSGFDKHVWTARCATGATGRRVTFTRTSPDGEEGYPGNARRSRVTYTLTDSNELISSTRRRPTSRRPSTSRSTATSIWPARGPATILDHESCDQRGSLHAGRLRR